MTREEILKELELWPLWKLKAMVPDLSAEAVEEKKEAKHAEAAKAEQIVSIEQQIVEPEAEVEYVEDENAMPTAAKVSADNVSPLTNHEAITLQVFASDDGQCLLVHHGASPTQDEIQIRHNIARAMGLNVKLLAGVESADQLLENHSPKVLVLFGEPVAHTVLQVDDPLAELRGIELDFNEHACIATFDMHHLLANMHDKPNAWQDLCLALALINIE